jgi:hypothetical protein
MGRDHPRQSTRSSWRLLLALFCVLLIVVAGAVQVAHTHADSADSHADCSLCAAAHVTLHLVPTPAPAPTVAVVTALESLRPVVVPSVLSTFALFTRPPPASDIVPAWNHVKTSR